MIVLEESLGRRSSQHNFREKFRYLVDRDENESLRYINTLEDKQVIINTFRKSYFIDRMNC